MDINNIPYEDYQKIFNIAYNNQKFNIAFRNIDYKNVYAIATSNLVINPENNSYNEINQGFEINLYAYKDHKSVKYTINSAINPKLTRYISKYTNNRLKEKVINKDTDINDIENINAILTTDDNLMTNYIINHSYPEIYEFIKRNINKTCDIKKEYIEIDLEYKGKVYTFYTNNTDGFNKIITQKTKELQDTKEYINTLKSYKEENYG